MAGELDSGKAIDRSKPQAGATIMGLCFMCYSPLSEEKEEEEEEEEEEKMMGL